MENNNSLLKFSDEIQLENNISNENRELIEIKMWNLLGKWTERYTMGDSTSVPIEIAEELLKSISFSIGIELRDSNDFVERLINDDMMKLLKESWVKIEAMIDEGKVLLKEVIETSIHIGNISYEDTIREIEQFFKRYDYRFFAHQIDCSIDYQLSNPISEELQGIEYINKYLKTILIENKFCSKFSRENIINILNSYCSDYKGLLINIFEPVVINTLGLSILEEDILGLDISKFQRERLLLFFKGLSKKQTKEALADGAKKVCDKLNIKSNEVIEYIKKTCIDIYPRLEEALAEGNIENIFLSFEIQDDFIENVFIDNEPMNDEKLRDLIDEIKSCRFISDKIAIVKQEIHSLEDLIEVLGQCFWGDEPIELFKALSKDEIELIRYYLENNPEYYSDSGWEKKCEQ